MSRIAFSFFTVQSVADLVIGPVCSFTLHLQVSLGNGGLLRFLTDGAKEPGKRVGNFFPGVSQVTFNQREIFIESFVAFLSCIAIELDLPESHACLRRRLVKFGDNVLHLDDVFSSAAYEDRVFAIRGRGYVHTPGRISGGGNARRKPEGSVITRIRKVRRYHLHSTNSRNTCAFESSLDHFKLGFRFSQLGGKTITLIVKVVGTFLSCRKLLVAIVFVLEYTRFTLGRNAVGWSSLKLGISGGRSLRQYLRGVQVQVGLLQLLSDGSDSLFES